MRDFAVHDDDAFDALIERIDTGFDLRIMPPESCRRRSTCVRPRPTGLQSGSLNLSRTPGHVGKKQQALGFQCAGDCPGKCIGIDVECPAVGRGCYRRKHGDHLAADHLVEHGDVDFFRLATKPRSMTFSILESGSTTVRLTLRACTMLPSLPHSPMAVPPAALM